MIDKELLLNKKLARILYGMTFDSCGFDSNELKKEYYDIVIALENELTNMKVSIHNPSEMDFNTAFDNILNNGI